MGTDNIDIKVGEMRTKCRIDKAADYIRIYMKEIIRLKRIETVLRQQLDDQTNRSNDLDAEVIRLRKKIKGLKV